MMAIDKEFMKHIDTLAWNRPETIPQELIRNDMLHYRIYFRFMCALYLMYRKGFMSDDELKTIKAEFVKDLERFDILSKAAVKSARDSGKLALAVIDCRKNSSCECCRAIAELYGAQTAEDEEDITIEGQEG